MELAAPRCGQIVWSPKLLFAGVITHYLKSRRAVRLVKPSSVLRFLEETFGPSD